MSLGEVDVDGELTALLARQGEQKQRDSQTCANVHAAMAVMAFSTF